MKCQLCGSADIDEFLDLHRQPLANKYPTETQFETEDFFPLTIFFCSSCKNVQLGTSISRDRMFEEYFYLSSVNAGLVRHFENLAANLSKSRFVVDVGSNDGILLKPLKALGVKAVGVEPSVNVSKIANDQGLTTICSFFDAAAAAAIKEAHGAAEAIVASSVFTHLEDPHAFIEAAKSLLSNDGQLVLEVEYIGNILQNIQFERFYLDRIFYYSLTSLVHLFDKHGMVVADVKHIEPHGGSIRVNVTRKGAAPPSAQVLALVDEEKSRLELGQLRKFGSDVTAQIEALRNVLQHYKDAGLKIAGYGAPARLSTICNLGQIGPSLIAFTVDDNPLKQGRHTPGTHIPIVSKEHLEKNRPDLLVVFAYEYFNDIKKAIGGGYRYLLPIPPKEVT